MTVLIDAMRFAADVHKNQKYGDYPFIVHPIHVAHVAQLYSLSEHVQVAAWLHDVLEDTNVTYSDLKREFGEHIAELVYAVTDELGKNRKERIKKTHPKIIEYGSNAIALKLADQIANVESCRKDTNLTKMKMYRKEFPKFKEQLQIDNEFEKMWKYLDHLFKPDLAW